MAGDKTGRVIECHSEIDPELNGLVPILLVLLL